MQVVESSDLGMAVCRIPRWVELLRSDIPMPIVVGYMVVLLVVYIVVVTHTPLTLFPGLPHDDGLFMRLGQQLAEGRWLGPYDQFTLIKGIGYPAFLAVSQWAGFPVSLAHALFHCFAMTAFVIVLHRFIRSFLLSGFLLTLLLWHPVLLSAYLLRVLREEIYSGQVMLILAAFAALLFMPFGRSRQILFSVLCGAILGWFWLTREEGVWIIPGIFFLISIAIYNAFRTRKLRDLFTSLAIVVCIFAFMQVGVRTINLLVYGKFVDVEVKDKNFVRALGAINSVRSGDNRPFISVTKARRERIYAVSPSFASLTGYFDGPPRLGWESFTCQYYQNSCGEIAAGWFMWALRDAAAQKGHLVSPTAASAFFKQIADEISSACDSKELECSSQLIPEMPQTSWADLFERVPPRYRIAADLLLLIDPPLQLNFSGGTEAQLDPALHFLNRPLYNRSPDWGAPTSYRLSAWYYRSGRDWISIQVKNADGTPASAQMARMPSPDIQAGYKDPEAFEQRFTLVTTCVEKCVVQVETPDGSKGEKTLGEIRNGHTNILVGGGTVHIDSTELALDPFAPTRFEKLCNRLREFVLSKYFWLSLPTLIVGAFCFLATTTIYWRTAVLDVNYLMALVCWLLAFVRTNLLILIDATSFPALANAYIASAYFLMISAAVLSCAALLNLAHPRGDCGKADQK